MPEPMRQFDRVSGKIAIVTGAGAGPGEIGIGRAIAYLLAREGARVVCAERADRGMGASLAAGVAAVPDTSAYVVALADMPWIESATIERMVQALAKGASIVAPVYRGERGHPVGVAPLHRQALLRLDGDEGARALLVSQHDEIVLLEVDDPGVLADVDTRAQLPSARPPR